MTHEELQHLITMARWFCNLGKALPSEGIVSISAGQWQRIIHGAIKAEFRLPGATEDLSDVPDFDWLNEELERAEEQWKEFARTQGMEDAGKTARLEAFRWGQISFRQAPEQALLVVGPTNLNVAARQAALLTCRVAASEVALEKEGLGCWLLGFYHQGHWPFGRATDGRILVL